MINVSKLTEISSLYFETTSTNDNKYIFKFIVRLIVKIFSKSRYEHVANILKCPTEFDGFVYEDSLKSTTVKAGEFYVFEATQYAGVIMTPLNDKLQKPSHDEVWSGSIDIQLVVSNLIGNLTECWLDAVGMLKCPYTASNAVFSVFDQFAFTKKLRKIFVKQNTIFCSMFSIINWCTYAGLDFNIDDAQNYSPEEVLQYLCKNNIANYVNTLLRVENGQIISINSEYKNGQS